MNLHFSRLHHCDIYQPTSMYTEVVLQKTSKKVSGVYQKSRWNGMYILYIYIYLHTYSGFEKHSFFRAKIDELWVPELGCTRTHTADTQFSMLSTSEKEVLLGNTWEL